MIGNFFKITCPYLYELNTITYFSILRNNHSHKTIARIRDITQLLLDVYHDEEQYYLHPLKVWNRYSPTMFLPHVKNKNRWTPIANSADTAKLFSHIFKEDPKSTELTLDFWDRLFLETQDLVKTNVVPAEKKKMLDKLCRMVIARDGKMLDIAKKYLSLEDLLTIKSRMIGTGFIGGKSVGMLLARKMLTKDPHPFLAQYLEPHDSFYVGADVFYTYLVENGWWKLRVEQKNKTCYFMIAEELRSKMLKGIFPEEIKDQFQRMIEYFGQSPIIVRSSSLLEDNFGNAFAGKYESVFLVNQGTPEKRYADFVEAVRRVYASTMNNAALEYRLKRGLDQADEQMALLVQRVSGTYQKQYFFPDVAGVGISYNTFVWKEGMDPKAGMLRLVAGLGTRAVNRVEGDYPRIVAMDEPLSKPQGDMADIRRFSQHDLDVLNIKQNTLMTMPLSSLILEKINLHVDLLCAKDHAGRERGQYPRRKNMGFDIRSLSFKNAFCPCFTRHPLDFGIIL